MNLAQAAWEQNHLTRLRELLDETAAAPERGFEWYYWQRQLHLEAQTLRGHTEPVLAVAFSPDGQRIVTGSADDTAKVWDAATGKVLLTLKGTTARSGPWLFLRTASGLSRAVGIRTAKVWDAASGKELLTLKGHTNQIFSVAFSPDGQRIVTGSRDQTAKVWDAASGKLLPRLKGTAAWCGPWPFPRTASGSSPAVGTGRPRCGRRPTARNWSRSKDTATRSFRWPFPRMASGLSAGAGSDGQGVGVRQWP